MSFLRVAQNCPCVEESCRTWTEDRVGILVSCDSWSSMGSNRVCCWEWINMDFQMRYTSRKDTLFSWYSDVFGFCSKVSGRLGNVVRRSSLSVVQSAESQYVCSQCKRRWRIGVYKGECYRGGVVLVARVAAVTSSAGQAQPHEDLATSAKYKSFRRQHIFLPRHSGWPHQCFEVLLDAPRPPWR